MIQTTEKQAKALALVLDHEYKYKIEQDSDGTIRVTPDYYPGTHNSTTILPDGTCH